MDMTALVKYRWYSQIKSKAPHLLLHARPSSASRSGDPRRAGWRSEPAGTAVRRDATGLAAATASRAAERSWTASGTKRLDGLGASPRVVDPSALAGGAQGTRRVGDRRWNEAARRILLVRAGDPTGRKEHHTAGREDGR